MGLKYIHVDSICIRNVRYKQLHSYPYADRVEEQLSISLGFRYILASWWVTLRRHNLHRVMRGFVLSDCVYVCVCEWKEREIEVRISFGPLTVRYELAFQTCKIWALYNSSSRCLLGRQCEHMRESVILFQGLDDIFQLLQGALHSFDSFRIPKDNVSPLHLTDL